MEYFDEYLSPEIFLKFSISSFLAASQRGIVFESEKKNIFISCPWHWVALIKASGPFELWISWGWWGTYYMRKKLSKFFVLFCFSYLSAWEKSSYGKWWTVIIRDGKQRTLREGHSRSDSVATTLSVYNLSLDLDQWLLASIQSWEETVLSWLVVVEFSIILCHDHLVTKPMSDSLSCLVRKEFTRVNIWLSKVRWTESLYFKQKKNIFSNVHSLHLMFIWCFRCLGTWFRLSRFSLKTWNINNLKNDLLLLPAFPVYPSRWSRFCHRLPSM